MKLYFAPGACSIGIHVILEEIGKPYETEKVNLQAQEQYAPGFKAINPKSKVPTLQRDDGSVLTEFPAIATWLARTNADKNLLPKDPDGEARALEAMDYIVATMHMQGFGRMFRPGNYTPDEANQEAVKQKGREIFENGFKLMDKALDGKEYLTGAFSVADAALFYVEYWAAERMKMDLPAGCAAHYARMKARAAVKKVMADEGLGG